MIDLVDCPPYSARLTAESCATRWRYAGRRNHDLHKSRCTRCPIGEQRAGGARRETRPVYVELERTETHVQLECGCGRRKLVTLGLWEGRSKPLACTKCWRKHHKTMPRTDGARLAMAEKLDRRRAQKYAGKKLAELDVRIAGGDK